MLNNRSMDKSSTTSKIYRVQSHPKTIYGTNENVITVIVIGVFRRFGDVVQNGNN